jgi:ABC-2 type transport system ATP-binding protein
MLCGLLMPTSGSGHVADYSIIDGQEDIKKVIGYMSQKFSLYDDLSVTENLEFFGSIYGLENARLKSRINEVIEMVGIEDKKENIVRTLPGGIKQRLALGAAVIHDPGIIFLDEPTSGVDPLMRRQFWDEIYKFSEAGKTIFLTTHYMDEAEHCERIALIIAGKIIALDNPKNLKESLRYDVYLIRAENFIRAFDIISEEKFIKEAALFGTDIHILTEKCLPVKNKIIPLLKNNKIEVSRFEKITPSLEDVFVTHAREFGV